MTKQHEKIILILLTYCVIFYSIWAINEIVLRPQLEFILSEPLLTIVRTGIIKNIVWILPAILLIKKYHESLEISLKDMFSNKVNWFNYLPIFLIFTFYILISDYVQNGSIGISQNFKYTDLIIVLFVGLSEELVFRGWLLNATIKDKSEDKMYLPMLINSILFLVIHFPKWFTDGILVDNITSFAFLSIMVLSILFSYTFVKSKNIIVPILLHMYWDLLIFVLI